MHGGFHLTSLPFESTFERSYRRCSIIVFMSFLFFVQATAMVSFSAVSAALSPNFLDEVDASDDSMDSPQEASDECNDIKYTWSPMMQPLLHHPAFQNQHCSLHAAWLEVLIALNARSAGYDMQHAPYEQYAQQFQADVELQTAVEMAHRFRTRLYSVVLIKSKLIYRIYIANVPQNLREVAMPHTPRCDMQNMPTRKWRYLLYQWDAYLKHWFANRQSRML